MFGAVLSDLSSFAIISLRKRDLVVLSSCTLKHVKVEGQRTDISAIQLWLS